MTNMTAGTEKKISVIISAYNAEKYIEETILSVLNQTYKDFELLVVDDGSTDKTAQIAGGLLNAPHRLISKKNGGEASARNEGLKNSLGEYIAFLDADDLFVPNKVAHQVNFLNNYKEYGLVYGKYNYIIEPETNKNWKNWNFNYSNNGSGDIFIKQFIENKICIITTMVRKECFDKVGLFDETMNYASDSDMWIRIAAYYKIGFLDEMVAYYRLHNTNVSLDRETCLVHRIASMNKNYETFKERIKNNKEVKSAIKKLYYRLLKLYLKKHKYKEVLKYFKNYLNIYK